MNAWAAAGCKLEAAEAGRVALRTALAAEEAGATARATVVARHRRAMIRLLAVVSMLLVVTLVLLLGIIAMGRMFNEVGKSGVTASALNALVGLSAGLAIFDAFLIVTIPRVLRGAARVREAEMEVAARIEVSVSV